MTILHSTHAATRITSERAPRDYGLGRSCECGGRLNRYNPGPLCAACCNRVPVPAPILYLVREPIAVPEPTPKPPRPVVRVLGINPETVARRRKILRRLKRLKPGEWLLRPLGCPPQLWHQDIAALRDYVRDDGYEVEARRTVQGGIRLGNK